MPDRSLFFVMGFGCSCAAFFAGAVVVVVVDVGAVLAVAVLVASSGLGRLICACKVI
jgi:hypothetical protein